MKTFIPLSSVVVVMTIISSTSVHSWMCGTTSQRHYNIPLMAKLSHKDDTTTTTTMMNGQDRRNVLGAIAAAIMTVGLTGSSQPAFATSAKTGAASPFTGDYDDPNHPGCLRQVKVVGAPIRGDGTRSPFPIMEVVGYDGPEGATSCTEPPPSRDDLWKITGIVQRNGDEAILDFSPKGGPSSLLGKYDKDGIIFPDGNKWTKIPYERRNEKEVTERRPKDMSTLKSTY